MALARKKSIFSVAFTVATRCTVVRWQLARWYIDRCRLSSVLLCLIADCTVKKNPTRYHHHQPTNTSFANITITATTMSTRIQTRQLIKNILIRRIGLPPADDVATAEQRRRRIQMIKKLAAKIETSLYKRSLSMDWYEDQEKLEQRVFLVVREFRQRWGSGEV